MGGESSAAIVGTSGSYSNTTISDLHFDGIEGYAINLLDCDAVVIERCTFANVGACIRLGQCTNVVIRDCAFWNIQGPSGAFVNNGVFVQAITSDAVVVEDCWGANIPGECNPEDVLSMFQSTDVTFQRNRIWGHGPSTTATTINIGDGGGCEYGRAIGNVVAQSKNSGIAVSGGDFMAITDNIVFTERATGSSGVTVWNFYALNCSAVEATGNRMRWGGIGGFASSYIDAGGCGTVVDTGNTWNDPTVTESEWTPTGYYGWEG